MKCIQCGTDNNLRDRTGNQGRCTNCNHPFAFEPTSMGQLKMTDPFFAKVIADISANNTLFFTSKQFGYFLDKRLKSKSLVTRYGWVGYWILLNGISFLGGGLLIINLTENLSLTIIPSIFVNIGFIFVFFKGSRAREIIYKHRQYNAINLKILGFLILVAWISLSFALNSFFIFVVSILLAMSSIYLGTRPIKSQAEISQDLLVSENQFQEWLNRWSLVNGQIIKMLPSPREESTPALVSPEVSAYSFDRLVVCDSAAIAQLLIANNFHFENNCAVLSITGYPQSIFSTVMEMLRRNPELKVYALHNATPRGVGLVHHLRTNSKWFRNSNVAIIDLGLLPRQFFNSNKVFVRSSDAFAQAAKQLPAPVREQLSTEELDWLESGKFVELESFTPQKLMQVVTQGIVNSRDPSSSDSLVAIEGDSGGVMIFASDSFG